MPRSARPGCITSRLSPGPRRGSYEGEVSEAPPNLLRDEEGKHRFGADRPSELRITDVTGFRILAGKACLSPIVDCFDGMPLSWLISTSPDAEMANSPPIGACGWLNEGAHPTARSDRGGAVAGRDEFGPRSPPQHLAVGGGNNRQREGAGIFIPAPSIKFNGIVAQYCALSFELLGDGHCGAGKPSSCWESR